jgi:hypothetical protein
MSFSFIDKWRIKVNSFLNNPCKVTSFEVITPKMDFSSSSTIVGSIVPLTLGFEN